MPLIYFFNRTSSAIFLVSASALIYEIGLTRIFSTSQGYHFAFMVISIALLGIGAGGAVVTMVGGRWSVAGGETGSSIHSFLSTLSALFSVVSLPAFIAANNILFDPVKAAWNRPEFLKIMAQYLILSLPFVISGMILAAAYRSMSDKVHTLYLADMAGAGIGCIMVLYILSKSAGEGAVIASAVLSLAASLVFLSASDLKGKTLLLPIITKVLVLMAVLSSSRFLEIKMSPYRELASALNFPGARVVETIFSPSGRMDIIDSPAVRSAPGLSLAYQSPLPPQLGFTVNGGGLSTVTERKSDLSFLHHLPSSLPYNLKKGVSAFIVNPGGGMEALSAIEKGAKEVSGSETMGIVIKAMKGPLSEFSGNLYDELKIRHGYARDVMRESGRSFDIVQVPLTDTLGSSSSGFMGFQEEYNLTVEAFTAYFKHLKKDGLVSASIYLLPPPRQELKLLATIAEALEKTENEKVELKNRIIAIRSWGVITILAKNGTITDPEIKSLKRFCADERFDLVWYPGMKEDEANIYNRFPEPLYYRLFKTILEGDRERFYREYIFDVRPATDDRPFFGQTFKMTRVKETYESVGRKWGILIEGGYLLPWVLAQSILASIVLIISPLFFSHLFPRHSGERVRGVLLSTTAYFSSIGIGYMFIEISLMQRMIPVLGEPIYAVSAVLFTLLIATGTGSRLSGHFRITERYPVRAILAVPVLIIIYLAFMGLAADKIAAVPIVMRFILTFLLFFPLGIVMGMPFPTGVSLLGRKLPNLIPWAWCINGSFSVISSVLAMMVAMVWGFSTVHILAAASYLVAWLTLIRLISFPSSAQKKRQ